MRNITAPRTVSFEEALRNLASRLTGVPASTLPRTQEGVVQFMAENLRRGNRGHHRCSKRLSESHRSRKA